MNVINILSNSLFFFFVFFALYHVFRKNMTAPVIAFFMMLFSQISGILQSKPEWNNPTMLVQYAQVLIPPILAFVLLLIYSGYFQNVRVGQKKMNRFTTDIYTKAFVNLAIFNSIGAVGLLTFSIVQLDGYWRILGLIGSSLLVSIFVFAVLQELKIGRRLVILLVGKEEIRLFTYEIPKEKRKVVIQDFFKDDRYIIDKIGEVRFINDEQKQEMHYLYWLATKDEISMIGQPVRALTSLPYETHLSRFEKYHYRMMTIKQTGNECVILKNQVIR